MNKKYQGKVISFWELLKEAKVEIPIIQRDYAQGREDKTEIRSNFLNALFESINGGKAIKLDFIYGSIKEEVFQPLDGQQRLTTLFLLYWYSAIKDDILTQENKEILIKFSYETRISSREFCNALVRNYVKIDETLVLSEQIIDSSWFFLSWKKDPTIDAMLRTLDHIHKEFLCIDNLWSRLINNERLISFYHVELENIGITDDLYIKMNARGKLLSPYENFKASFLKKINDSGWDSNNNLENTFAVKIDTVWTDLFWKHRKNNSIDESIVRFISTIIIIQASIDKRNDRLNLISKLHDSPKLVRPSNFTKADFDYLGSCLDIYYKVYNVNQVPIPLELDLFYHKTSSDIFKTLVFDGQTASYSQKVLFFAQTQYFIKNDTVDKLSFNNWMRVVRNIISRGDVTKNGKRPTITRSPQTFEGVVSLINELAEGSSNIYEFLASNVRIKSTFAKEQLEEERLKANIIVNGDEESLKAIHFVEDNNLLYGRIEFALYCIDYSQGDTLDVNKLNAVGQVILNYLNNESHLNNDLRRALLTISDDKENYEFYGYWWSFWYAVSANKRCLLDKYRELEFFIYGNYKFRDEYRVYLKKLIIELMNKNLKEIINDFNPPVLMPNWKIRLIKDNELLDDSSKSNYIAIPEDNSCCYLLKGMRPRNIEGCEKIE